MSGIQLQVADRFPAGTTVGAYPAVHDTFTAGQTEPVATGRVAKDGTLKISGLTEHGPYHLAAEVVVQRPNAAAPNGFVEEKQWRSVSIVASDSAPAHDRVSTNEQAEAQAQARQEIVQSTSIDTATAPAGGPQILVEGPRNTENSRVGRSPAIAKTIPFPRIEDQKAGTPLRSHTATGEAHPVPKDERQPKPTQDDLAKGTKQRSDTEVGEATPVDPGETQPSIRQEDFKGQQASDTETGAAAPVEAEEPRETRARSSATRSKSRQAKRQKANTSTSTGKAQARSQAAGTTKRTSATKRASSAKKRATPRKAASPRKAAKKSR